MSYYFTGSDAASMEATVKGLLQSYLDTLLNSGDNASKFAPWNGVNVIWDENLPPSNRGNRQLWLILKINEMQSVYGGSDGMIGDRQEWTIDAECIGSEYTSAGVSKAAVSTTRMMGDAMRNGINQQAGYIALREMKLTEVTCRKDVERQEEVERINPHKIEFVTLAIPS